MLDKQIVILKEQKKDLAQRWVSNQNVQAILLDN